MIYTVINEIKEYLEKTIQDENYVLNQLCVEKDETGKRVQPKVTTGNLPHQNFNLYGADDVFFQAPYVLVGFEESDENLQDCTFSILVQVCCCTSTYYDGEKRIVPDNKAFEDCVIFLEWIKNRIIKKWNFSGMPIDGRFKLGTYDSKELTYPYSFGYISFGLENKEVNINRSNLY